MKARPFVADVLLDWPVRLIVGLAIIAVAAMATVVVGLFTHSSILSTICVYGIITAGFLCLERIRHGGSFNALGMGFSRMTVRHAVIGALIGISSLLFILSVAFGLGATLTYSMSSGSGAAPIHVASVVLAVVLGAYGEELVFHGPMFETLREAMGDVWSVFVTSVLFSAVHAFNPEVSVASFINVFLAGVLLGTLAVFTASLWASVSFHVVWNLLVSMWFGSLSGLEIGISITRLDISTIEPSLRWLVGDDFGIESGGLTTVVLIVCTLLATRIKRFDAYSRSARLRRELAERARRFVLTSPPRVSAHHSSIES